MATRRLPIQPILELDLDELPQQLPVELENPDELLDDAAQGQGSTSDEIAVGRGEIDAMGVAAGLVSRDDRPFRGVEEVDRRDDHRWELDPASAEDAPKA